MIALDLTRDALDAVGRAFPPGEPICMLNLLRYRGEDESGDARQPRQSSREAYFAGYVPAFAEIARALGVVTRPLWLGSVTGVLVGPGDEGWDDIALVQYPSFAAFRRIIDHPDYLTKAEPHRVAALANWRLLAAAQAELPG